MAINEDFLEFFSKEEDLDFDYRNIFAEFVPVLEKILNGISEKEENFSKDDVEIYLQGSYLNNVNVGENTSLEIVLELKKTKEKDFAKLVYDDFKTKKNREINITSTYSLLDFKKDVYYGLLKEFSNNKILITNHTITIVKNLSLPVDVEILPAFSFNKLNNFTNKTFSCILVYEEYSGKYIVSYPNLHSINLEKKNKQTDGLAKKLIRLFKNLRDYLINEGLFAKGLAPGYFIDCLVYNIPNNLFHGKDWNEMLTKILNYLNNKNLNEFVCVHNQFEMFGNGFDQWELKNSRAFVNALVYGFLNIKE